MSFDLGLTACYFNPCGYSRRRDNYFRFYEGLGDYAEQLTTVELAFDDADFHLDELPNRLSFRTQHLMWQKEALLNIGIRDVLSRGYEYVSWLDADIIFINDGWYDKIIEALLESTLVQVFEVIKRYDDDDAFKVMKSTVASMGQCSPATGFGWACPSSLFADGFGLYTNLVVGGGDTLIYAAAFNELRDWFSKRSYSLQHIYDIIAWSNEWYSKVAGDIGYAENKIDTFFHGNLKNRNYLDRHEVLLKAQFDPATDLGSDESGVLTWDSDKGTMHSDIRDYFASRKEDD